MTSTYHVHSIAITILEFADYLVCKNDTKSQSLLKGIKLVFELHYILKREDENIKQLSDIIYNTKPLLSCSTATSSITDHESYKYDICFLSFLLYK